MGFRFFFFLGLSACQEMDRVCQLCVSSGVQLKLQSVRGCVRAKERDRVVAVSVQVKIKNRSAGG